MGTVEKDRETADETATQPPRSHKGHSGRGEPVERVTVNLNKTAAADLERTSLTTAETKTEVINKALQLYAFLRKLQLDGGDIFIREADSKERERLRLL
ncbi:MULTISPECIES: hypothetical protein [Amycolatopsis]|uniref:Uncharacterized protein n=2 Tax=Amycolatopsis TaxID=1813 RepID=A0A1I3WY01_9PSEU|nr:hypothetical protein [Amycolatopsis sacchari]SFK12254.1 hypothetical protein SAMN05421835_11437 [Amycolatopsis sacchari]